MAGKIYEIKTTLAMDGEQKFKQAIEDANRSMKVMDSEMRKAKAAYQAGGDGVEYFNAKAEAMSGKVKQQEAIVKALEQAVEESAKAYGEASKQADTYRIKLNQAEATLIKMRKASKDADKEAEELGRDAKKVGQQIKDGIGDGAEEAAKEAESAFDRLKGSLDDIRNNAAMQTAMQVGNFVVDSVSSVMGFIDENAELNRQRAIAEFNLERYGFRYEELEDLVYRATALTGDREGAIAAVTSLAQYGFEDVAMLEAAMNAIMGGVLTRPGLSMETIAEDILNTINTREASGAYAELITEVLGLATAEEINTALQNAQTQQEAAQIAMSFMTMGNLQTYTSEFIEQEQEMVRYQMAAERLATSWADLAETLTPFMADFVTWLTDAIDEVNRRFANSAIEAGIAETQGISRIEAHYQRIIDQYGSVENAPASEVPYQTQATIEAMEQGMGAFEGRWHMFKGMLQDLGNSWIGQLLFPSAGAEEMTEGWAEAANAARLQVETELSSGNEAANAAGVQLITEFGAGIEQGTAAPIESVQNMVNQINSLLGSVNGAYSLGLAGVGGVSLVVDGQELGRAVAHGVSTTIGNRVATRMYAD